jgi:hypothetical protein
MRVCLKYFHESLSYKLSLEYCDIHYINLYIANILFLFQLLYDTCILCCCFLYTTFMFRCLSRFIYAAIVYLLRKIYQRIWMTCINSKKCGSALSNEYSVCFSLLTAKAATVLCALGIGFGVGSYLLYKLYCKLFPSDDRGQGPAQTGPVKTADKFCQQGQEPAQTADKFCQKGPGHHVSIFKNGWQ